RHLDSNFEGFRWRGHRRVDTSLSHGIGVITQVSGATGIGVRVPRCADHVGDDDEVAIPTTAGGNGPQNLGIVKDIDVLIYHPDVPAPAVYPERGNDRFSALPRNSFLDLDVGMKTATSG